MKRRFQQVDVFSPTAFLGNPVAVVLDGDGLIDGEMQRFTRWMNLSETTFLLPPSTSEADYRVRIFTPAHELPFAGHPTLGSCHAWLEAGNEPRRPDVVVQECGAGLVTIRRGPDRLAFEAPPLVRSGPAEDRSIERIVEVLGVDRDEIVDVKWVDNGPGWVGVLMERAESVLEVEPDLSRDEEGEDLFIGLVGPYPDGHEFAYEVRALFPDEHGLREDPVTGSLNASLAQWLLGSGRVSAPYVASQGARVGRAGRVHIDRDDDGRIWVGGATVTYVEGELSL